MPHPLDILPVATDAKLDCYGENGKAVEKKQRPGEARTESRYDARCYFNVRSKPDMSQLNLPHGTDN